LEKDLCISSIILEGEEEVGTNDFLIVDFPPAKVGRRGGGAKGRDLKGEFQFLPCTFTSKMIKQSFRG